LLKLSNISCQYNEQPVFKKLNFEVKEGGLVVVGGPNGSGKTTLLQVLAGLRRADYGIVTWQDKPLQDALADDLSISYIGHEIAVKKELTVLENIEFWAKLGGDVKYIGFALKTFELERYKNTLCSQLSSGLLKRVALCRLVCCPGLIWILDEPYNNLDNATSDRLDELIDAKCKDNSIIILSSHIAVPMDYAQKVTLG